MDFFSNWFQISEEKRPFYGPNLGCLRNPQFKETEHGIRLLCNACCYCTYVYCVMCILHSRVEWFSTFFQFLKTFTFLLIRSAILAARQSFHFQKITGTLKSIFFWNLIDTILIHQRTICQKKFFLQKNCLTLIRSVSVWYTFS